MLKEKDFIAESYSISLTPNSTLQRFFCANFCFLIFNYFRFEMITLACFFIITPGIIHF